MPFQNYFIKGSEKGSENERRNAQAPILNTSLREQGEAEITKAEICKTAELLENWSPQKTVENYVAEFLTNPV